MGGFRIVWKGLRDSFQNVFLFVPATLVWWLCAVTVVLAPGATVALFRFADPRLGLGAERPSARESLGMITRDLARGWKLALLTLPLIALLVFNLFIYSGDGAAVAVLAPVWLFLLLILVCVTLLSFAMCALQDKAPLDAIRLSAIITMAKLPRVAIVLLSIALLSVVSRVVIVPLVLILPATIAAIIDRLLLQTLGIAVLDPSAATEERQLERQAAKRGSRWRP